MCSQVYISTTDFNIFSIILIYGNIRQSAPSTDNKDNTRGLCLSWHWRGHLKQSKWRASKLLVSEWAAATCPSSREHFKSMQKYPSMKALPATYALKPTFMQSNLTITQKHTQQHRRSDTVCHSKELNLHLRRYQRRLLRLHLWFD